jgi:two-component system alkaline phosphatase synthesis response regulator PhoP
MIYIVEDDKEIREMETYALHNSGFQVSAFSEGLPFFKALETDIPDLVILDIMLPNSDGLTILKRLHSLSKMKNVPVMMVTARTSELDKVKGLDAGADDYLTKPFGIMEFLARVKALLRRSTPKSEESKVLIRWQKIEIDDARHLVTVEGKPCELTFKEYELLKLLCASPIGYFRGSRLWITSGVVAII